jgi:chaperone required for assembly of F1-ATPase
MTTRGNSGNGRSGIEVPERFVKDGPLKVLPKRFYKTATVDAVEGGFRVLLDGRAAKTPVKRALVVPTARLGTALADEWNAQGTEINPAIMPLTTLATTAIDAVAGQEAAVAEEIAGYAGSDLLCYRADGPKELVAAQAKLWDPPLAWAGATLGIPFKTTAGIMHVAQDERLATVVERRLERAIPLDLAATHVLTTITGSAILALMVREAAITGVAAWAAAHVDEDHQIALWGRDEEAEARRARRRREFDAAVLVLAETTRR